MPRRPRLVVPGLPLHLVQRGAGRAAVFFDDHDRRAFLDRLARAAADSGCAIHAYVLMTNHIHLLVTPDRIEGPARLMQNCLQRYVRYVNARHDRTGTLWQGRYRSVPIRGEGHLLACYRYIELNPVRAGLAGLPHLYPWSSHAANAAGRPDPVVTPHSVFLALGATDDARQAAYHELFAAVLTEEQLFALRRGQSKL